jgi:phosphoribosylanthranilate isomerase
VGVFVNESFNQINHIFEDCQLDRIQLHGEEPPDWITRFAGRAFKAIRPQSAVETTALLDQYLPVASTTPPYFLLDAYHPNLYGGTGHVTDWTTAADLARHLALMLAGSLTPANVAEAITAVQPWAVDVSSGLEAEKGRKDHDKIRAFMAAVRETTGE